MSLKQWRSLIFDHKMKVRDAALESAMRKKKIGTDISAKNNMKFVALISGGKDSIFNIV